MQVKPGSNIAHRFWIGLLRELAAAAASLFCGGQNLKDFSSAAASPGAATAANMYGGMGGGGNAWMKIMGISGAEVSKRNAAKEKGKGGPAGTGSGGVAGQNAIGDPG